MNQNDEGPDDFFRGVGRALSEWSLVEHGLCQIYRFSVGDTQAAYDAFWSINAMESRMKMTDVAFRTAHRKWPKLIESWENIHGDVRARNTMRNKIAHGTVLTIHRENKSFTRLVPFMFSENDPAEFENGLTFKMLDNERKEFKRVQKRLREFVVDVLTTKEKQP